MSTVQKCNCLHEKRKKEELLTLQYQKEHFTLNMLPNKQNKLRQMKKDLIKKSHLNYTLENMLSVSLFGNFSSYKLTKHIFFSSNLFLVCLLKS